MMNSTNTDMGINGRQIARELEKVISDESDINVGMFTIKGANTTILDASVRPDPDPLWKELWYEGEVCCLFADSNLGKSIYAVQIANEIAKSRKVLYFDFELSDKQFQLRYTDDATRTLHKFPDNLYRVEINQEAMFSTSAFEETIIKDIEEAALKTSAKVLIIDNLTYLCSAAEKGELAGILMMRLMQLKRKYQLSILVLAHTPKRQLSMPITQNDLAGSKKLYNFFDSVFAIGKSAKDDNLRYIKQLKVRYGGHTYDSENVIVCQIEKVGAFLQFTTIGYSTEYEHLKERTDRDREQMAAEVKRLSLNGYSIRGIANELNISKSKVDRLLKQ